MPPSGMARRTNCRCWSGEKKNGRLTTPVPNPFTTSANQPPSLAFNAAISFTGASAVAGRPRGSTADT